MRGGGGGDRREMEGPVRVGKDEFGELIGGIANRCCMRFESDGATYIYGYGARIGDMV